jgi:hypothetical protein
LLILLRRTFYGTTCGIACVSFSIENPVKLLVECSGLNSVDLEISEMRLSPHALCIELNREFGFKLEIN